MLTWRHLNALGAALSVVVWGFATYSDLVSSVRFISHVSMITMVFTFVAAWRADAPSPEE